jgi:hypothetical protein
MDWWIGTCPADAGGVISGASFHHIQAAGRDARVACGSGSWTRSVGIRDRPDHREDYCDDERTDRAEADIRFLGQMVGETFALALSTAGNFILVGRQ